MIWQVTGTEAGYVIADTARKFGCVIGKTGMTTDKREGDQASPIGHWPMRALYYRPDRVTRPNTALPVHAITPDLGWCDDPDDAAYNLPVALPYPARHETMWRADHLYDVVITLGYNDAPPIPMAGSAIFLHLRMADTQFTAGCVAVDLDDMLAIAAAADTDTIIAIG